REGGWPLGGRVRRRVEHRGAGRPCCCARRRSPCAGDVRRADEAEPLRDPVPAHDGETCRDGHASAEAIRGDALPGRNALPAEANAHRMILASAHAYDHSVDHYDQDIDRAKQDRLSGASLDGLVSIAYWIGHTRSASGHAPSARWPAPLSRSLLVCSSNAGLTGPRRVPRLP